MNAYKKIIKSRKLRFRLLRFFRFVPDKTMLRLQYRVKCGRKLNLKNPERYTEKIQWYKLYYRDPVMQQCADKLQVREYIKSKGLAFILNDLYAVFSNPDDITLEQLPQKFVLKLSNGSGTNLIVKDKQTVDTEAVKRKFRDFYAQSSTFAGREWVYKTDHAPVIIAEKYLRDPTTGDGALNDYKFLCFHGQPCYVVCDIDRFTDHRRNIYDTQWNDLRVASDCACSDHPISPPENLNEMLEIAKILSADFPAVRVDLYSVEGKVYFGELTFFPWSGYVRYSPDAFDYEMGKHFVLPEQNHRCSNT